MTRTLAYATVLASGRSGQGSGDPSYSLPWPHNSYRRIAPEYSNSDSGAVSGTYTPAVSTAPALPRTRLKDRAPPEDMDLEKFVL